MSYHPEDSNLGGAAKQTIKRIGRVEKGGN
jgi:hypothetical protein